MGRVGYTRDQRDRAKAKDVGLFTVDVIGKDGSRQTFQGVLDDDAFDFLLWAGLFVTGRRRPFPDLKHLYHDRDEPPEDPV